MTVLFIKPDYRYKYLIYKALEVGDIKRIELFIKIGKLVILNN